MARLKNWSFGYASSDPYKAPEQLGKKLYGEVYDHPNPRHYDGKFIITSSVVEKLGPKIFKTASGTIYELEEVDPNYKAWIEESGRTFNSEDPIQSHESAT